MVSLFINTNTAAYFDSFGIEYIPQDGLNKIKDKSISHNIFRIQSVGPMMCRFYYIAFIQYMISGKTMVNYTILFSPNDHRDNNNIINKYFKDTYGKKENNTR